MVATVYGGIKMAKIIAISNQKGGVGKTTLTCNVGIGIVKKNKKVLLIDADPQGNLSSSLGIDNVDDLEYTLAYCIECEINDEKIDFEKTILHNDEGVDILPCNINLAAMDYVMMNAVNREYIVSNIISYIKDDYDYIFVDCSPSLNLVTMNVLTAADSVIIPIEASYLSMSGLQQLLKSIGSIKKKLNKKLYIEGIVINKFNSRVNHEREIIERLREAYGEDIKIFSTLIPESVRAKECSAFGVSIFRHDPKGKVAKAYTELINKIVKGK